MAPVITARPNSKPSKKKGRSTSGPKVSMSSPVQLLAEATDLLQENEPQRALVPANAALTSLRQQHGDKSALLLPALTLISEIQLELGDTAAAYGTFQTAASIDPDGLVPEARGGGADKFLYLAQLDEAGGRASLAWFEKAVACLEREYFALDEEAGGAGTDASLERAEKRTKLAHALCGMCELWMTDLSFDDAAAEDQCEKLITQAVLLEPDDAQTLATLASIRLSQAKLDDARAALDRCLELCLDLPPGHPAVPEFAARVQLARTLMEAGMEAAALEVCERLVAEEDQSVEAWYLGGWCQHLMATTTAEDGEDAGAEKAQAKDAVMDEGKDENDEEDEDEDDGPLSPEDRKALLLSSREWLRNCLRLCQLLEYEDDRLRDHAKELVESLDKELGDAEIDDEEEWEGIRSDEDGSDEEDEEMDES